MNTFLRACWGKPTTHTPIWLMRQAGRYQPEYRALREKVSFLQLCRTPELATEVTVRAAEQLGVDAAIIFADILLILEPLGVSFSFTAQDGPQIERMQRPDEVQRVSGAIKANDSLSYVMQTVRMVRAALPSDTAVIGFSGSPFTLASYILEGGGSKNYLHTKTWMYTYTEAWHELLRKITLAIGDYLRAQIEAGAEAVQVFDSWVGCLSPHDYETYVAPHMRGLFAALPAEVPVIHFGTGNPALYPLMKAAGGHVLGVDWRDDLVAVWDRVGGASVMGNLDPAYLLASRAGMCAEADRILTSVGARPGHVFNLGHGVFPQVQVDQARALVDFVHERSHVLRSR
jgi:uroporphyrinogen decarboxylase